MNEKEEEARWKLKFILSVVRVTRIAMNLGYLTTDNIELIVGQATQTLTAFARFGINGSSEHWLRRFLNRLLAYGEFDYEIEVLIMEVSNLLRLYQKVKLNLQLNSFLTKFYNEYNSGKTRKTIFELHLDHHELIQEFEFSDKSGAAS